MDKTINPQRLHGKNVVVIGGSKGLGRAIVAVVEFASHPRSREGNAFLISGKGIDALP